MNGARLTHRIRVEPVPERAQGLPLFVGAITVAAIAFLMGAAGGDASTAVLSAMIGGILISLVCWGAMGSPRPRRSNDSRGYAGVKALREARETLAVSREYHAAMLRSKQALRRRLVALRAKMEVLALPAYSRRIANIDVALGTIDKQMAIATQLRNGYDKSITMIEIELESGAAAHHLNDDASAMIAEAIHELRSIEETEAELGRQLEANVEVEMLLRR